MRLLVLFLTSALVCLSSSQLCLDEMEVAAACVAQTNLSARLMSAMAQCEGRDISSLCSHWSSSFITALSLVGSFIVMLRQLSYAIKNQLKAPKAPY